LYLLNGLMDDTAVINLKHMGTEPACSAEVMRDQ